MAPKLSTGQKLVYFGVCRFPPKICSKNDSPNIYLSHTLQAQKSLFHLSDKIKIYQLLLPYELKVFLIRKIFCGLSWFSENLPKSF